MFICQCLPGYGRFSIHIKTENRTQVISKREYKGLDLLYFCADIEQAFMLASMFLYIWVTISVIYQVCLGRKAPDGECYNLENRGNT
uniref:Uncharacterized protein n=1 Tax=Acrobeloides nanus TaxID=290746 RepID=A0A914E3C2_9BILA